jgi:hypothetical protein
VIDLAPVNEGAWRTACLFGGYTRPVDRIDALSAVVSQTDRRRLAEATGLRLSPVEESEMLIAFLDEKGQAQSSIFRRASGRRDSTTRRA